MIDEKRLIYEIEEDAETRLLGYDGSVSLGEVKEWVENQPKIDKWIPTSCELPSDDYLKCYVTVTRKDVSNEKLRFTTEAEWVSDEWYWGNGKPMKNNWIVLAWQKRKYPDPYKGE